MHWSDWGELASILHAKICETTTDNHLIYVYRRLDISMIFHTTMENFTDDNAVVFENIHVVASVDAHQPYLDQRNVYEILDAHYHNKDNSAYLFAYQ